MRASDTSDVVGARNRVGAHDRVGAIVVGAGGGQRLGGLEKAFMPILGKPMVAHSVEVFEQSPEVHDVCLVVSQRSIALAHDLVRHHGWQKVVAVVPGGSERQDSVRAGLDALGLACEWVIVHDAARPLITCNLVARGLDAVRRHHAAVAAVPVRDTLKRVHGQAEGRLVRETIPRDQLWAAQTPQVFREAVLRQAFQEAGAHAAEFTDDASLVEAMGWPVAVFEGSSDNLKVTYPEDVPLVEALLRARLDQGSAGD